MTDTASDSGGAKEKPARSGMALGLVFAGIGAVGGFFATRSGLIPVAPLGPDTQEAGSVAPPEPVADIAYVALDPILVSVETPDGLRHLRFQAQLEVSTSDQSDVELIRPRIVDVLNGYLRALEPADLTGQQALIRMRGQMLRRVAIVAGTGRVRDLLVTEFVLN